MPGGCIAADVHGKADLASRSFGHHVRHLHLIGPDGRVQKLSAETRKAAFRATIGGMGQTGAIASARIALRPAPSQMVEVEERRMPDLDALLDAYSASLSTFSVAWIDATARGRAVGRGILEEADFTDGPAPTRRGLRLRVPIDAPRGALAGPVVRGFNRLWYARVPEGGRTRLRAIGAFLHPLDGIADWNRLYGARGFHQVQVVVPEAGAAEALHAMLGAIGESGLAAPLAVLKRLGGEGAGLLSFPMAGWTLAVDLVNRPGVGALAQRLAEQAGTAGGRLYLAKDALAGPGDIAAMYPALPAFHAALEKLDPEGWFATDLARRTGLRAA
ncbi:MAG: FAD-binding oxidoreductase [Pseudomonadota bacterium]